MSPIILSLISPSYISIIPSHYISYNISLHIYSFSIILYPNNAAIRKPIHYYFTCKNIKSSLQYNI